AVADGVDDNEAMLTIVDASISAIHVTGVQSYALPVYGTTSQQTVTTDAAGKAIVRVTSTKAGEATIAATVGGTAISGSPVTVTLERKSVEEGKSGNEGEKHRSVTEGVEHSEGEGTKGG